MLDFEDELVTLIFKWLDKGADSDSIIAALKKHATVVRIPLN